jgi:hypothetical protein
MPAGDGYAGPAESRRSRAGRPERPLDPGESPAAAFAAALRGLRTEAGGPSYRELARRALFSASVLSTAASGSMFPSLRVTLAFAGACGGDTDEWRRRWEAVNAALARATEPGHGQLAPRRAYAEPEPAAELPATPAELPATPAHYTGRQAELTYLATLTESGSRSRAAAVAISGPIGIGKTALALHFAQHATPRYPDGQLYADLARSRAYGESAHDVTGRFLSALGTPVPADPQQRTGLYRSVLAARRVLVVLDNADSEAEVRPLLGAGRSCLVVVTSRRRLAGLDSIRRITLDVLRPAESQALVSAIAGDRQAAAATSEVGMLGELCGQLPLAVWIAATQLADHHGRTPQDALERLQPAGRLMDWLAVGDVSVRRRLSCAYLRLDSPGRRAFRRLGTVTSEIGARGMADLLGVSDFAAEQMLETLVDAGLLQASRVTAGYRVPRLFALFARELLDQIEPAAAPRPKREAATADWIELLMVLQADRIRSIPGVRE